MSSSAASASGSEGALRALRRRLRSAGELAQLGCARANRPRHSPGIDRRLGHARAEEVTAALGEHVPVDGPGLVAHSTRQIAQAKAEARAIQVLHDGAADDSFQLADARILPAAE